MSTYSQYGSGMFEGADLIANEAYAGAVGGYRAIEENSINMHKIFESVIGRDFAEAYTEMGVLSESTLEAMNEAAVGGIWEKVKAFFKKIGEKILGILKAFKDKIVGTFTRDGKALVKKFEKQILKKVNTSVYKESFKWKWSENALDLVQNKGDLAKSLTDKIAGSEIDKEIRKQYDFANKTFDARTKGGNLEDANEKDKEKYKGYVLDAEKLETYEEKAYSTLLGESTTKSDFAKDYAEKTLGDTEEKEGFDSSDYSTVKNILENGGKVLGWISKEESEVKKYCKDQIKKAEEIQKETDKLASKEDYKVNASLANTYATNVIKLGNIATTALTTSINCYMNAVKSSMKMARAVWVKAATYGGKSESALMEAIDQVSNYEVDEIFG